MKLFTLKSVLKAERITRLYGGNKLQNEINNGFATGKAKKRKKIKSKAEKRTKFKSACFLAPSFFGVTLFFGAPFLVIIYYAFLDNPITRNFVGFENFKNVWNNFAFRQAAKNTLTFSAIAVPLAVVLSLLLAIALEEQIPMKSKFRTFFLSPMMVPVASIVLIWQVIFHNNGALNDIITLLGGTPIDWFKSSKSQIVVIVLFLWKNLGYNMILFMAALSSIPKASIEAAEVDGAGSVRIFFSIKMRYISSSILFVTILSLINSFKVFREVYLLTGDHPYDSLYMLQHFMNNVLQKLDYQKLSAASIIMFIFMVIIIGILFVIDNHFGKDVE